MPGHSNEVKLTVFRLGRDGFVDGNGEALAGWPMVLAELYDYWDSRRGGRDFPARTEIDPVDIPALLEHVMLVEVLEDPLDFHYRLVGGHFVEQCGRNLQGTTLRALLAAGGSKEKALFAIALDLGTLIFDAQEPVFAHLQYYSDSAEAERLLKILLLPLGESGARMNMILAGLKYAT